MMTIITAAIIVSVFGLGMATQFLITYWRNTLKLRIQYYNGWDDAIKVHGWKRQRRNKLGQFIGNQKKGEK